MAAVLPFKKHIRAKAVFNLCEFKNVGVFDKRYVASLFGFYKEHTHNFRTRGVFVVNYSATAVAALKRFLKSTIGIAVKINAVFYQLTYLVGAFVNKCVYGVRCVGLTA